MKYEEWIQYEKYRIAQENYQHLASKKPRLISVSKQKIDEKKLLHPTNASNKFLIESSTALQN